MYCRKCGTQLDSGSNFCKSCGEAAGVEKQPPVKPNKKTVTMIICAIVGFAVIICATVFILSVFDKSEKPLTVWEILDLGEKYLHDLKYEQALVQFLRVIDIEPMNPRGYTGAAESYIGLGRESDAIMILEQGLAVIGESSSIRTMLDHIIEQDHGPYPEPDSPPEPPAPGGPDAPPEPTPGPETPTIRADVYSAYYELLNSLITQHGISNNRWDNGLWRATLIDFDGDGTEEFIIYYLVTEDWGAAAAGAKYTYGCYSIYGYDSISKKAFLISDYNSESHPSIEYRCNIFKGADGKIYLGNIYARAYWFVGEYYTLENNEWKTVISYDADFEFDPYGWNCRINGEAINETDFWNRLLMYENEVLFTLDYDETDPMFDDLGGDPDWSLTGNINEIMQQLALEIQ